MVEKKTKRKRMADGAKGSRGERLAFVVQGSTKRYKKAVLSPARDHDMLVVPRVSTGLYGLDVATNGGIPLRRVTLVYGGKSGGKTTTFLRALGRAQRLCANCSQPGEFKEGTIELPNLKTGKVEKVKTDIITDCPCGNPRDTLGLWIDAEGVWLPSWAERMGVDTKKVILMRPTYGEQAYDIITAFAELQEIDIIVVDSLAALTPAEEHEAEMEEKQQGAAARMNNKFIRKIVGLMNEAYQNDKPMTVWLINQYRQKIGVTFGPSEVVPGGKGQHFANTMEIEFRPGKVEIDKEAGEPLIGDFYYHVKRNKVGPPGGKGTFRQWMSNTDVFKLGDLMEHEAVIEKAVALGFVERPSKVTYQYKGQNYRGVSTLVRYFGENPIEFEGLKDQMLKVKLGIDDES